MAEVVLSEIGDDGVAVLTLNRPDRLNAWTYEMQLALFDRLEEHASDEQVRVIVLTGSGRGSRRGQSMSNETARKALANRRWLLLERHRAGHSMLNRVAGA